MTSPASVTRIWTNPRRPESRFISPVNCPGPKAPPLYLVSASRADEAQLTRRDDKQSGALLTSFDQHFAGLHLTHPSVCTDACDLRRRQSRKHLVGASVRSQWNWLDVIGH